ncbi:MAG: hypothetical protein WBF14_07070 [Candidatus Acidiferrales bacterium]
MEADISIWHKTGHFYFALTRICNVQDAREAYGDVRAMNFAGSRTPAVMEADFRGFVSAGQKKMPEIVSPADDEPARSARLNRPAKIVRADPHSRAIRRANGRRA